MTFYGKTPDAAEDKKLRTFTFEKWSGKAATVDAHYVQFMPGHVSFWQETGEEWDVLVLAVGNRDVNNLREAK